MLLTDKAKAEKTSAHLSGNFSGFAYTTGLMAAKNAADYIKELI